MARFHGSGFGLFFGVVFSLAGRYVTTNQGSASGSLMALSHLVASPEGKKHVVDFAGVDVVHDVGTGEVAQNL
jgi:hypothetical protein